MLSEIVCWSITQQNPGNTDLSALAVEEEMEKENEWNATIPGVFLTREQVYNMVKSSNESFLSDMSLLKHSKSLVLDLISAICC